MTNSAAPALSPAYRNRVRELFAEGIETPPPQRPQWLDRRCRDLPAAVRDAVAGLLSAHDEAGDFLRDPTVDAAAPPAEAWAPPATIGPYAVGRELGRGGFGTVYLAEQAGPLRRRVALKLINPGMDTRQVVARFGAERQALALMDHPNIARVYDAGATPGGRPYFVMEWVDGPPVVAYARRQKLDVRRRLGLFVDVCRAVQHAHQKGVVHRDVKPSNVLVATVDGRPVPKVIDFGVAKAVGDELSGHTVQTAAHQFVGTPQYMSPEQADPAAGPADTRVDVYGLGVLLYELLSGHPPFDAAALGRLRPGEVPRFVRETEPVAPSRRALVPPPAADAAAGGPTPADDVAERRRLARALRGDLDWIVARATAKEPDRRYPTADALAEDVLRHLHGLPVEAGPPSPVYRARKFVRRNRAAAAAAAAVAAAVIGGGGAAAAGWRDAASSRDAAVVARDDAVSARKAAQSAADAATAENRKLRAAQHFLHQFLFAPTNRGTPPPVQTLDYLGRQLEAGPLRGRPELEAPLRLGLGQAYLRIGLERSDVGVPDPLGTARRHFDAALACSDAAGPAADPFGYVACHDGRGRALLALGRWDEAAAAFARAVDHCERLAASLGDPTFPGTSRLALADALIGGGKPREAAVALDRTLDEAARLDRFTGDAATLCRRVVERADRLLEAGGGDTGNAGGKGTGGGGGHDPSAIRHRARELIAARAADAPASRSAGLVYPPPAPPDPTPDRAGP